MCYDNIHIINRIIWVSEMSHQGASLVKPDNLTYIIRLNWASQGRGRRLTQSHFILITTHMLLHGCRQTYTHSWVHAYK